MEGAGKGDGFADGVQAADPGDDALDAHAEAAGGDRAVAAQVEVPLEGFFGQLVLIDACVEQLETGDALRASDNFAVAFRGEDIDAKGVAGVERIRLHVEGFDVGGIAMNHDGLVVLTGEPGFVGGAEVVSIFKSSFELTVPVCLVEHLAGFVVAQAREGRADGLQLGGVAADDGQFGCAVLENGLDDVRDEVFGKIEESVEVHEGDLRLDHPELGEVAAGFGFFRAEGGAEAVNLAQGEGGGLDVELAGLGEVGGVAEVFDREEGGGAFAGRGSQDGRVGADEAVGVKVFRSRAHDFGPDAENGGLARRADPKMAMLHEEVDAVLLGSDGVGVGLGDTLDDLEAFNVEFEAAGSALVGTDFAADDDAGFLGEALEGLENFRGDAFYVGHALDGAGAVAKDGEKELAALAKVVEPTAEGDGLAFMLADGGDGGHRRWGGRYLRGRSDWVFGHSASLRADNCLG